MGTSHSSPALNVSSTTVHQDIQSITDECQDIMNDLLTLSKLALAPNVTMDFTLSFSGTLSLGTCGGEPGLDAAEQMPVCLHADLQKMLKYLQSFKTHRDELINLKLGGDLPVEASGLALQEVAQLYEAARANTDASSCYLTSCLESRLERARRKDGRGRLVTPPSNGGGDILNQFSLNTLLPGPGTAGRHRRPVILKLDQTVGAGRHLEQECRIGQFWRASFWHSQPRELRAFCNKGCSAVKMQEEKSTPKVVRSHQGKCSFKSIRISRRR